MCVCVIVRVIVCVCVLNYYSSCNQLSQIQNTCSDTYTVGMDSVRACVCTYISMIPYGLCVCESNGSKGVM